MTGEFRRLQEEQYILFCHKQHDYGSGNISVGTQLQTEEEVLLSLTGLWFRMNDKIQRLKNLLMMEKLLLIGVNHKTLVPMGKLLHMEFPEVHTAVFDLLQQIHVFML